MSYLSSQYDKPRAVQFSLSIGSRLCTPSPRQPPRRPSSPRAVPLVRRYRVDEIESQDGQNARELVPILSHLRIPFSFSLISVGHPLNSWLMSARGMGRSFPVLLDSPPHDQGPLVGARSWGARNGQTPGNRGTPACFWCPSCASGPASFSLFSTSFSAS